MFPEEFTKFLVGRKDIRDIFFQLHGDLYDVEFWWDTQEKLRRGEIMDVFPYHQRLRFKNIYKEIETS
ncbi:MAG: bifunctional isocitrate dehydrogenase kinase/phosphatase [Saprospiraceae bacterium]|nr:bifunctional isocitrate dehydrogenase kinase/phosphatase [Saprospiraceae bacterium]